MLKKSLNYAARAEKSLKMTAEVIEKALADGGLPPEWEQDMYAHKVVAGMIGSKDCQHFSMPDGGKIFDDKLKGIRGQAIRLPFPKMTIEYYAPTENLAEDWKINENQSEANKRLILAMEWPVGALRRMNLLPDEWVGLADMDMLIQVWQLFSAEHNDLRMPKEHWSLGVCNGYINPSTWDFSPDYLIEQLSPEQIKKHTIAGTMQLGVACHGGFNEKVSIYGYNQVFDEQVKEVGEEICTLLELLEALSCRNVKATVSQPACPKNAKRIKQGKLPIYETKVLTLDCPGTEYDRNGEVIGAIRNGVRQHLRRGHIRRLQSGVNIWVNSCVVGSADNGVIKKDYKIRNRQPAPELTHCHPQNP